jgi:hypothetical protein
MPNPPSLSETTITKYNPWKKDENEGNPVF